LGEDRAGPAVKLGVMLPTFEVSIGPAVAAAEAAEAAGLDGVFAFDHLWPMGNPGLPALSLFPVLAAALGATTSISVGALVARIGLEPDEVLEGAFSTLSALAPGRVIAGIGTGDQKSEQEGLAFGLSSIATEPRRQSLAEVAGHLRAFGLDVWIGGGGRATNAIASSLGCRLNLWAAPVARVASSAKEADVTWGGQLPRSASLAAAKLADLARAGASWVVVSWKGDLARLREIAEVAAAHPAS
jgi:alkanesulfonate monooxygenase SsuD/methylene tetrahydromethanopterin reductase-like flavin-dependent oxidoreductase (luciferase family)